MLAKRYRLPIQEFIRRAGHRVRGVHVSIQTFPSSRRFPRVGIIAGGLSAVLRNALRRRIMDLFASRLQTLPPLDFLVIVRKKSEGKASASAVVREIETLIAQRAGR